MLYFNGQPVAKIGFNVFYIIDVHDLSAVDHEKLFGMYFCIKFRDLASEYMFRPFVINGNTLPFMGGDTGYLT